MSLDIRKTGLVEEDFLKNDKLTHFFIDKLFGRNRYLQQLIIESEIAQD